MKITKEQLKQIIKEEMENLTEATNYVYHMEELTEIVDDLKAIFRQFDVKVLTKPSNLELIKSKVDELIEIVGTGEPVHITGEEY